MEKKMVRPCMTAEARDVLNKMQVAMKYYDRSQSIIEYYNESQKSYAKQALGLNDTRKKIQEWKVYCVVLACTTIASLVALAIQAA